MNRKICQHLSEAVRIPTVSFFDPDREDEAAFERFDAFLRRAYPAVFEKGTCERVGRRGYLITLTGGDGPAAVLMAHYDVVPADPAKWTEDPFSGRITDTGVWGRGTLDTKGTLIAILEAAEEHLESGRRPKGTLYLAFSGEEEVEGESAHDIARLLKARGIRPAFVLDEGGAVIPEGLPGVPGEAAMIGIAEKGVINVLLTLTGQGGHASTPPKHTLAGRMAKAACAIEKHRFRPRLTPPVIAMFEDIGRRRGGLTGFLFRHVRLYARPVALLAVRLGGTFRAMVSTTAAVTMMSGSPSYHVLPDTAALGLNLRLLPGDDLEAVIGELRKAVDDPAIRFDVISGSLPSPVSVIGDEAWQLLTQVTSEVWPGAMTAPYTLNGGTDSRFYHEISDHVYKLTPIRETKADRETIHWIDEHIRLEDLDRLVDFYRRLISRL